MDEVIPSDCPRRDTVCHIKLRLLRGREFFPLRTVPYGLEKITCIKLAFILFVMTPGAQTVGKITVYGTAKQLVI